LKQDTLTMADDDFQRKPHPPLNLPKGDNVVDVCIINTTTDIVIPAGVFVQPVQKGHETMNLPTFAFSIENKQLGKTIMFDLGCRKDWWNHAPSAYASIKNGIPGLNISKNVNEILKEGGVDDKKVDGVVWSHFHCTHILTFSSLFPLCLKSRAVSFASNPLVIVLSYIADTHLDQDR